MRSADEPSRPARPPHRGDDAPEGPVDGRPAAVSADPRRPGGPRPAGPAPTGAPPGPAGPGPRPPFPPGARFPGQRGPDTTRGQWPPPGRGPAGPAGGPPPSAPGPARPGPRGPAGPPNGQQPGPGHPGAGTRGASSPGTDAGPADDASDRPGTDRPDLPTVGLPTGRASGRRTTSDPDDAPDAGTPDDDRDPERRSRRRGTAAGAAATSRPSRGRDEPVDADPADGDADDSPGDGSSGAGGAGTGGKKGRKGSFWRELPLLIVVAVVLTFAIQTFVARIYVIPSASMEQTLHGCTDCTNDRVAVDKVTYDFSDPEPGDVVVFRGPPTWVTNDEVASGTPSDNVLVRGFTDVLSLVGLAEPNEKDFVKRVIATGGQTVACCDPQGRVTVDGQPLTEPYLHIQAGTPPTQAAFDPVRVPDGQLWVMGDNRNNSADARFHGPIGVSDVIGKVRAIVLPVDRWRSVPAIDPQPTATALPAPGGAGPLTAGAGVLLVAPLVARRWTLRRRDPDAAPGQDG